MKCPIHPKYRGKKKPKLCNNKECTCVKLFLMLKNKPRAPHIPTQVIKDKTKYNRTKKHRNNDDEE